MQDRTEIRSNVGEHRDFRNTSEARQDSGHDFGSNGAVTRQSRGAVLLATLALAFGATRCGSGTCEHPPCPLPTALIVFITSASGEPIISGSIQATGMTAPMACHFGSQANMCMVLGAAGTYNVSVTASGYVATTESFVVTGHDAACGCGIVDTRMVTIALSAV